MSHDIVDLIRKCLHACVFTNHARLEMEREPRGMINVDEVLQALGGGEILETYGDDQPYPSYLILGKTSVGRLLHVVCAVAMDEKRLIVITTYEPDPTLWEPDLRRRKR